MYKGDFAPGRTIRGRFNTHQANGTPITLAGAPAVVVYKDGGAAKSTAGVALAVDHDGRTGLHLVTVDTSVDPTFYAAGSDFAAALSAGTVGGTAVGGTVVMEWSLANRTADVARWAGVPVAIPLVAGVPVVDLGLVGGQTASISSDPIAANVVQVEGQALSSKVGGNFNAFFQNAGADTIKVVDDVGAGGEGGGVTAAQIWDHLLSAITEDGSIGKLIKDNLDVAVSTRSTYAGEAVDGVKAPVTVGTNNDKAGYTLSPSGLDGITVEAEAGGVAAINGRQALALILDAAGSGQLVGAATSTVIVKNPGGTATRMAVSVDSYGNRTQVTLTPPA